VALAESPPNLGVGERRVFALRRHDAVPTPELTGPAAPAPMPPSGYTAHRAVGDWRLATGGPWVCSICHPRRAASTSSAPPTKEQ
jgi:hypothetical protein